MDVVILLLYLFSYVLIYKIGYKYFKTPINIISIFLVVFFLHNWSFSLFHAILDKYYWIAYTDDYSTVPLILTINLSCLWIFVFGFFAFYKKNSFNAYYIQYNQTVFLRIYYILTLLYFIRSITSGAGTYGEGQALSAAEAFNPINNLINTSRVVFGIIAISTSQKRKTNITILFLEIIGLILFKGRKNFICIIVAYLLANFELKKLKINTGFLLKSLAGTLLVCYFSIFIVIYRLLPQEDSFISNFAKVNTEIINYGPNLLADVFTSASSEGVQNWTYQLMETNELEHLYGMTYVQAIVNTIILRPFQGNLVNYQAAYVFKEAAIPDIDNMGFDFSFTAEAILNFGYFAFISYFLLAVFIALIYNKRYYSQFYNSIYISNVHNIYNFQN